MCLVYHKQYHVCLHFIRNFRFGNKLQRVHILYVTTIFTQGINKIPGSLDKQES